MPDPTKLVPQEERARRVNLRRFQPCDCTGEPLGGHLCPAHRAIAHEINAALQRQAATWNAVKA